jgi:DNA-binding Xre family transcriptional regulator
MTVINRVPELVAEKFGGKENVVKSTIQKDIGLNYATVSKWVDGHVKTIELEALDKWCKYLGVEPGDILVRVEE